MYDKPKLLLAGDRAVILEFANEIDKDVNRRVRSLAKAIESSSLRGIGEVIPTYRSLLINYDPLLISFNSLCRFLLRLSEDTPDLEPDHPRLIEIPTVYGGEFGPDLNYVAEYHGISPQDVVEIHCSTDYSVYMLGFTPGFPYLGGLSEKIASPRVATPRTIIPAGSVGIGGRQTGVYPLASPGGWQIIGRTPIKLFDPTLNPPVLLEPGDTVRFKPISAEEFRRLEGEGN